MTMSDSRAARKSLSSRSRTACPAEMSGPRPKDEKGLAAVDESLQADWAKPP
jgi:hypothetical protein